MRIPRLPGYRRQPPDPPMLGVMTPPPPVQHPGPSRRERRKQHWMDRHFWGLVHDHDWLQYDPREKYR